eukprot:jgi/Chlat1/749/Chrsp104S00024
MAEANGDAAAVGSMRTELGANGDGVSDADLRRWLVAYRGDAKKAAGMFLADKAWRQSYVPNGRFSDAEVSNELAAHKEFLQGLDKTGRPVLVTVARNHDSTKRDIEETKRFIVYTLDKAVDSMPPGVTQFCGVFDLAGLSYSNLDLQALKAVFPTMELHYPERLGTLWFVNAPIIFWGLWKLVYPFVDKRTRGKIVFLSGKEVARTLLKEIDKSVLPKALGGDAELCGIGAPLTRPINQ